jgi:hypothetical protein
MVTYLDIWLAGHNICRSSLWFRHDEQVLDAIISYFNALESSLVHCDCHGVLYVTICLLAPDGGHTQDHLDFPAIVVALFCEFGFGIPQEVCQKVGNDLEWFFYDLVFLQTREFSSSLSV